tara:strand:- start:123 stop:404 length:282 start_codon:yes stop_codon:yes gene_type:complete
MPALLHLESSPWAVYNGGLRCKGFKQGEVREVSNDLADYLLSTFPGCFEVQDAQASEVAKPEVNRAMKAPAKKRAPAKKKAAPKKPSTKKAKT